MSTQTTSTGTPVSTAAPTMTLHVTDSAVAEIKKFMTGEEGLPETAGLRVRVVPGGCSGFQYSLNIEEESKPNDHIIESNGVRMFVDMFSAQYPNATGGCGCGSSFTA